MSLAAERDLIARQYTNQFQDVFGLGVDLLARGRQIFPKLSDAIVFTHVGMMTQHPDSLIARKCGWPEAQQSQAMAAAAFDSLNKSQTGVQPDWSKVAELDFWLRAKGNQRNPGTTADLVTASLFVAVYNGVIQAPFH
jgi:triphosphoribosyl-dephospho-CoA synthase